MANVSLVHTTVKTNWSGSGLIAAANALIDVDWNAGHGTLTPGNGIQITTDGGNPPIITFSIGGTATTSFGGSLIPSLDNTFDIGQLVATQLRWRNIFVGTAISVGTTGNGYLSLFAEGAQNHSPADIALNSGKAAGQSIGLNVGGDIDIAANLGRVALISGSLDVFVDGVQQAMYPTGPDTVGLGIGSNAAAHWNGIRLTGAAGVFGYAGNSTNLLFVLNAGSGLGLYATAGDSQFAVNLVASGANGALQFGPGGASAPDVFVERNSGNLRFLANSNRIMWDGTAFSPVTDNARDLGIQGTQRWRNGYFAGTLSAGTLQAGGIVNFSSAQIQSSLIPTSDLFYNLGSSSLRWASVFAQTFNSGVADLTITTNLRLRPAFDNSYDLGNQTENRWRAGYFTSILSAGGGFQTNNTALLTWGNGSSLSIAGGAAAGSLQANTTFLPNADNSFDLGTTSLRWRNLNIGSSVQNTNGNLTFLSSSPVFSFQNAAQSEIIHFDSGKAQFFGGITVSAGGGFQTNATNILTWNTGIGFSQIGGINDIQLNATFRPGADNTYNLGATGSRWSNVFTLKVESQTNDLNLDSNSGSLIFSTNNTERGRFVNAGPFSTNAIVSVGVGIGSGTTPTAQLQVGGAGNVIAGTTISAGSGFQTNASLSIVAQPSTGPFIVTGSSVGIGLTSPNAQLDIKGALSEIQIRSDGATIATGVAGLRTNSTSFVIKADSTNLIEFKSSAETSQFLMDTAGGVFKPASNNTQDLGVSNANQWRNVIAQTHSAAVVFQTNASVGMAFGASAVGAAASSVGAVVGSIPVTINGVTRYIPLYNFVV